METAIRWSPNSTPHEQRFLVVDVNGHSFRRCVVEHYAGKDFQHRPISTYSKGPPFRAFDWAPHDETLVAVGQWSGEVTILRIDDASPSISLPAKHQRLCNAVAFSRTGLLAAGLERVRNDFCLNIWNVNQRLPTVSSPGGGPAKPFVEPYRKFASSEAISSIKFFSTQPEILVVGIKGRGVRIFDLRESTGNPSLQFRTDSVYNIAIDPLDENYFACAGAPKDPMIQIWDRRSGSPYTAASIGSGSDPGAQQDRPVLEYKVLSDGSKGSAQARKWDGSGPMSSSIWSVKYCKGKSGCLGALSSNGDFRVFETKHSHTSTMEQYKAAQHPDYENPNTNDGSILTKRIHRIEHAYDHERIPRHENDRIVAFDFTNLAGSKGRPCAVTLRGDQNIGVVELDGVPSALSVSSMGGVLVSKVNKSIPGMEAPITENELVTKTIRKFYPHRKGLIAESLVRSRERGGIVTNRQVDLAAETRNRRAWSLRSSRESHEHDFEDRISGTKLSMEEALTITTVARRRCQEGYLFNHKKNVEVVRDDPWLQKLWRWIGRAKNNAEDEGMVADAFDLSFFGVSNIWNSDLDSQRASDKLNKPTYSREIAFAVETLCNKLDLPGFSMIATSSPHHRRLCLYSCGLGLPHSQLESKVQELMRKGQNTKAAAFALIHDQAQLAFTALRHGTESPEHRELSIALAGYNKGTHDPMWDQTIRDLRKDLEDPYARAILALVGYGDWHDVLAETSLPLRDRVGIALMYLDDDELTQYINLATADSIKEGDIEGIVLTGLTEQAVPLFETYIHKFSDLQTAVLAMAFTCPRYFTDARIDKWHATYRSDLNDWRMFIPRIQFDVQSTKLSTSPNHKPELPPPPRQVSLRCNNCDQALDRNSSNAPRPESATFFASNKASIFGDAKDGTVCPRCGRHMPRCVVCMYWLGMPDPHSRGSQAAESTKKDTLNKLVSVCRNCWHMSHGGHAEEWFAGHKSCPVPECDCCCAEIG